MFSLEHAARIVRLLSAISHKEPDRVPVDLGATPSSGISAIAYGSLKRHLAITSAHNRVYDVVQQLAQPEDEILNRFGIDVVDVARTFDTADSDWYDVTLFDGSTAQIQRGVVGDAESDPPCRYPACRILGA